VSEQAVDLRSTWTILRRRSRLLVIAMVLGALAGLGLVWFFPPPYSSTSVVLLPSATQGGSGKTGEYDTDTQVIIATSAEILARAGTQLKPQLSQEEVQRRVAAEARTDAILQITAGGSTSHQAEELASAVAASFVAYLEDSSRALSSAQRKVLQQRLDTLNDSLRSVNTEIKKATKRIADKGRTSAAGRADAAALSDLIAVRASTVLDMDSLKKQLAGQDITSGQVAAGASVIQPATPGVRADLATDALTRVLGGAAAAVGLTTLFLVVTNSRDPKLRSRDEIADAVGIPVITSVRTHPPRSPHAWRELLRSYSPDSPDAWALRQLLHGLLAESWKEWPTGEGFVLVVLSLSGDDAGLAVGPQIASFAASNGIATQLRAAQRHESATTLWAACSHTSTREELPPELSVVTAPDPHARVDLTVRLIVLDRDTPEPNADLVTGGTALLAVSSASVTRRNLADAAVAADRVGLTIKGIVVANPDPLDRTTGRLSPIEMPQSRQSAPTPVTTLPGALVASGESASADGQRRPASKGRGPR
jgi:capsular polysaccharide biosynthesis protein